MGGKLVLQREKPYATMLMLSDSTQHSLLGSLPVLETREQLNIAHEEVKKKPLISLLTKINNPLSPTAFIKLPLKAQK